MVTYLEDPYLEEREDELEKRIRKLPLFVHQLSIPPNGGGKAPGGPLKGGGGPKCCGPKPNPPGGGPPLDSYAAVIWSMILCALSWPSAVIML